MAGRRGRRALKAVYFGKSVSEHTRSEVIALVAMMVGPNQFHPTRGPDALAERARRIERLLRGECKPRSVLDVYYRDCATRAS